MKAMSRCMNLTILVFIAFSVGISSCKKKIKEEMEPDPDLTTERDLSNSENDMNSISFDIDKAFDSSKSNLREEAFNYATIIRKDSILTLDGILYEKYIAILYNGTGNDGQTRNGKIEIFNKGYRSKGDFNAYVKLSNTKVGGRSISVTKKIVQQSSTDPNQWVFVITALGTITNVEGKSMTYSATKTRIRSGVNTLDNITDDSFILTGSWSGTNGQNESVSATVTVPLHLTYSCHYFREITSGKIDFTNISKGITRSIDYGNGGCDGKGTFINIKGKPFMFFFQR